MWDQLSYDVSTFELTSSNCVNKKLETLLSCESIEDTPNHDLTQALVEPYAPLIPTTRKICRNFRMGLQGIGKFEFKMKSIYIKQ
jgi:hypothetical protein